MKSRVSAPSSSRKCSATVRPVESDAETRPWRLGHLAIDQRCLALGEILEVDNAGLLELYPEVVALAGALAYAGEDGETAVLAGDVVDEFLNDDGLADAGAAEEADLAALEERLDEVDDLDAGLEHLFAGRLLVEGGGLTVDREMYLGVDGAELVHWLAEYIQALVQGSRGLQER